MQQPEHSAASLLPAKAMPPESATVIWTDSLDCAGRQSFFSDESYLTNSRTCRKVAELMADQGFGARCLAARESFDPVVRCPLRKVRRSNWLRTSCRRPNNLSRRYPSSTTASRSDVWRSRFHQNATPENQLWARELRKVPSEKGPGGVVQESGEPTSS